MENKAVDMEVKMAGLENKIADLDKTRGVLEHIERIQSARLYRPSTESQGKIPAG
jgi:hypothetical protein